MTHKHTQLQTERDELETRATSYAVQLNMQAVRLGDAIEYIKTLETALLIVRDHNRQPAPMSLAIVKNKEKFNAFIKGVDFNVEAMLLSVTKVLAYRPASLEQLLGDK